MMLVILNFRKDVNFIGQTVRRPGILLDFEAFSIYSLRNSSTRSNNLKLSTITPTELVNNSMKKKVKQIRFPADVTKNCTKICPRFAGFFIFTSKLGLKTLQKFYHQTLKYGTLKYFLFTQLLLHRWSMSPYRKRKIC